MSTATGFLRRDPADVEPWAETCGRIRPLIEGSDGAAAAVHRVDDEEVERHRGVVVYVPGGVLHDAHEVE